MNSRDTAPASEPTPATGTIDDVETVACTGCGSSQRVAVHVLRDYLYGTPGQFVMQQCRRCGLLYLSPRPTRAGILMYYPDAYMPYRPAIQDEGNPLMRWMRRRKLVKRRGAVTAHANPVTGRVLDVGCSTGIFLDEMRAAGWKVTGIELNRAAADYAADRFSLPVYAGDLLEIAGAAIPTLSLAL